MIMTNKILAVALVAVLVGASLGAIAMRSTESSRVASANTATDTAQPIDTARDPRSRDPRYSDATYNTATNPTVPPEFRTTEEQNAYKVGFADGFQSCNDRRNVRVTQSGMMYAPSRYSSRYSRRVYYDYGERRHGRSFWQKHRDKLTLGIGSGAGALIGGLVGGKKGAGIGALAGLGGSALYTYKLRKHNRRY